PVLRPAVQAEDDVVALPHFRQVQIGVADPDGPVRRPFDLRQLGQCSAVSAAARKSASISPIASTLHGTPSGHGLSGWSAIVFRPLPVIAATTTSSGPIFPSWASLAVQAIVVPPAGSVSRPSVRPSRSIPSKISGSLA